MDMLDEGEQQGEGTEARKSRKSDHRVVSADLTDASFRGELAQSYIVETLTINRRVVVETNNRAPFQPTDHSLRPHTVLAARATIQPTGGEMAA